MSVASIKQSPTSLMSEETFTTVNREALSDICSLTADCSSGIDSVNDIAVHMLNTEKNIEFLGLNMDINNLATGVTVMTIGVFNTTLSKTAAKTSRAIGDDKGFTQNFIKMALMGPIGVVRGVIDTVKSGLSIGNSQNKTPITSKVIQGLGVASFVGSNIWSVVIASLSITSIVETRSIAKVFNEKVKVGGDEAGFDHLKSMLSITQTEKKAILKSFFKPKEKESWCKKAGNVIADTLFGEKESKEILEIKAALRKIHTEPEAVKALLASLDIPIEEKVLSQEEGDIQEFLKEISGILTSLDQRKLLQLVLHAYHTEIEHTKEKKEAVFMRAIGVKTRELIEPFLKKNSNQIPAEKLKEITISAQKGLFHNVAIMSTIVLACMLNIIVGLIIQIMTGGLYFAVQLALNLVISTIWLGIDGYFLYQAYKEKHSNWKNRLLIALSTISMVVVSSIVSTLASATSNIIITGSMTFAWLFLILYGVQEWKKSSKKCIPA